VPDQVPSQVAIGLYRAIHEGVTNVVRHARATELEVSMEREADGLVCRVKDNGVGIADTRTQPAGLGLRGIRDRLSGLHGELALRSSPGKGTELIISIPVAFGEHADGN
jgi:signal transduction histidine kinase